MKFMIGHAYMMKPPLKSKSTVFRELLGEQTHLHWEMAYPNSTGTEVATIITPPPPPQFTAMYLFGYSSVSFNKLLSVSKCFSEFCDLLYQIN